MKRLYFGMMIIIAGILIISSVVLASSNFSKEEYRVTAQDLAEIQAGNRWAIHDGKLVQAKVLFHHRPGHSGGPGGGGGSTGSTCFEFISKGAKWKTTEQYVLDTTNQDGMTSNFVTSVTSASFETWDSEVAFDVFGTQNTSATVDGPDTVSPDDKNEVMFGVIDSPGVIAVAIIWGIFIGPPSQREIVEYDVVFNDPDYTWGDATINASLMDYQNIATHEFGHAAGLDHPDITCTEETMYAFADFGETKKRDLNAGDIAGITKLYS